MPVWVRTVNEDGIPYNFRLDLTWMVRALYDNEIRFKPACRETSIDVYYKNKEIRDAELKRIESILYKDNSNVG